MSKTLIEQVQYVKYWAVIVSKYSTRENVLSHRKAIADLEKMVEKICPQKTPVA